jgi:2-methylcitrate dehydratase PrpD
MLVEPTSQKQAPATAIDAKFSLPFCIGAALAAGAVAMPTFFEEGRQSPEALALAMRVRFTSKPELGMKNAASGDLKILLKGGRTLSHSVAQARGSPTNPLSDKDLIAKFLDCTSYARPTITPETALRLAGDLLSISAASRAAKTFGLLSA